MRGEREEEEEEKESFPSFALSRSVRHYRCFVEAEKEATRTIKRREKTEGK